jgi:membrane protease subunit (stomatin/prohibitin family)
MKVGDVATYKGGKNDFWITCKAFKIGCNYKITYVDDFQVMILGGEGQYTYTIKEFYEFFELISQSTDQHYNNDKGSLYLFAQQHELNAWEFDILKRIVRCRKKGQFKEDLEKTKRVIDLYLKEFEA